MRRPRHGEFILVDTRDEGLLGDFGELREKPLGAVKFASPYSWDLGTVVKVIYQTSNTKTAYYYFL